MSAPATTPDGRQQLRPDRKKPTLWYNLGGLGVFVLMAFPVYWMLVSAFRPGREIRSYDQKLWPTSFTLEGFQAAVSMNFFWTSVRTSLLVTSVTVAAAMVLGLLAAFAIGRFRFYGRRPLMMVLILVQLLPPLAMIIPLYLMINRMGGLNQFWALIVVYTVAALPFSVWMLRGFIINIPKELEESAMVDGCTRMGAFWRVVFPLIGPGVAATSVFALVNTWNEYLLAYIVMQDNERWTLPVWLMSMTTQRGTNFGSLMAASVLIALPVVIFFLIVQKKMAAGLTSGAVKG
ncbi:carbohydrate ABC transporter permease [Streptomyces sp. ACA25]|uniref:carbohydrate ABC transporter permease n=1 Tax=Streptomyces sp. ACA25 TaxID=3022596 RepID=UPI002307F406|nr:carbohydrate ABC transporter permease [Streptomyces sp. ACA25]MDB1087549.1 carbohydrate ABC transporter permease [Streptomyces sp. ACA25]